MQPAGALEHLSRFLTARGQRVEHLDIPAAVDAMIAFYADVRAPACDLQSDEDMLRYQWGTYDWGHGQHFELDITRQFILAETDDRDLEIWQLSLTFFFTPTPPLAALANGDHWCHSLDELPDFLSFILSTPSYAITTTPPLRIELDHVRV